MTGARHDTFDESRTGCREMLNGRHLIEWIDVPAFRHNGRQVQPAHRRGMCFACGQHFAELPRDAR